MKAFAFILSLILAQQVWASNSCFDNQAVKDLIAASEAIDSCFAKDVNDCEVDKMTVDEQQELSSQRLIPYDRSKNSLMNDATGVVSAELTKGGRVAVTSGQKISSCHIITSAHLLYKNGGVPVDGQDFPALKDSESFDLNFHTGQACDSKRFNKTVGAQVFFKMTDAGKDFVCDGKDASGACIKRYFTAKVIWLF